MTDVTHEPADRREPVDLQDEIQKSYLDYAMSVIVGRALPDARDGLKPVHRRILYGMFDGGYRPDRGWNKCARVVGEVMGQYHPHGDGAIYDTLVRLAQPWVMRYPLVAGQGNFGSPGNDKAAAMRYTECRMAQLAMEMVRDIGENTVDFKPNYDGKEQEPVVLPARFPNLLVNGSTGIAVGMATNIPTHNLREVASAVQWSLEHPEASAEELLEASLERVKGPDFPNGALIVGRKGIEDAYRTGRGSVIMRAVVDIEEDRSGRTLLVVTELPHMVNPDNLALKIAELVNTGKLAGIADIRDDTSARTGQRLVIVLKRDAQPRVVLNNLYKHTQLQDTFGCNMLALVDDVPRTLRLDQFISYWVAHQVEVIQRRTQHRLEDAEAKAHIYRALVKALDMLDEVIALIRRSPSTDDARTGLMALLEIDEVQSTAILDMQLRRLAALERQRIIDQLAEFERIIADLQDILARPERQRSIISDELGEIVEKYGDERRTTIIAADGDLSDEDLIPDNSVVVTITRGGYAKRTLTEAYRVQKRGGKGVRGASLRTDDMVAHLFATSNHRWILFFTNKGRVYRAKVWQLPEAGRDAKGSHVAGLLSFLPDEEIAEVLAITDYDVEPVPAAGHQARSGQEEPAAAVRLAAAGRHHRGQLPRRRRRADRRRAVRSRGRGAADLDQGSGDPVPGRRRPAAADGPGHLRRDRDEVPARRRAVVAVGHPGRGGRLRPLCVHRHRRRLCEADPRLGVSRAGPRRTRDQGDETQRGPWFVGRGTGGDRQRRGHRHQGKRTDHPQRGVRGAGQGP